LALICDTGPLYAAMDRGDRDHDLCTRLFTATEEAIVIPSPVIVELDWLASKRLGSRAFNAFLVDIEESRFRILDLTTADYSRVRQLCSTYFDLPLGFVDAAVLAVAERLQETKVATLDIRHFGVVRLRHVDSLTLLPLNS
jgi:uncharacterized protein